MTARPIMVQGTMSGVGKSWLVAGLCRLFAQEGLAVAPFKSQNMALNSHVCADGAEIGRAQAVQAEAAGIEPVAQMNPILLKPTTDVGSQVIVNGRPLAAMSASEYFAFKHRLVGDIQAAYDDLASRFDVVVIEGAGSPAEVNLQVGDIVNMGLAKMVAAPVLLVGDIDRGGVFAQLIGTMDLLAPDERALVKALVVNKFRGDVSILEPGLDVLRKRCGVPVLGVVPYKALDIDEEDSLSERLDASKARSAVDIAVVRFPRISNFTDFTALDVVDGASVRYVGSPRDLGCPDMVVLPGTKSTLADLRWLRESGFEAAVLKHAAAGGVVFGICGGFQMLGREVADPKGVEGGGSLRGLGLLPLRTEFDTEKTTRQVAFSLGDVSGALGGLSGMGVRGYEIHMGQTELNRASEWDGSRQFGPSSRSETGLVQAGDVYGTYVHGFFDAPGCAAAVVRGLMERKGIDSAEVAEVDLHAYRQQQYDMLAETLRRHMDIGLIHRILEAGA